jgi:hypothetical protein
VSFIDFLNESKNNLIRDLENAITIEDEKVPYAEWASSFDIFYAKNKNDTWAYAVQVGDKLRYGTLKDINELRKGWTGNEKDPLTKNVSDVVKFVLKTIKPYKKRT